MGRDAGEINGVGLSPSLKASTSRLERAPETMVCRDTLNPMSRVDVLDKNKLVTGSAALARYYSRIGQEVFPNLQDKD